jgi:hypothetical protein
MEQAPILESKNSFSRIKETYQKLLRTTALMGLFAAAPLEAAEPKEHVEVDKEKMEQVEEICHTHGFGFVDSDNVKVDLPPGEVKKVIFHIGWAHPVIEYDKAGSNERKQIVNSAQDVYNILYGARMQTGTETTCLVEGVYSKDDIGLFGGVENTKQEIDFVFGMVMDNNVHIEASVEGMLDQMTKQVGEDKDVLNFTMYKYAVAARRISQDTKLTDVQKERATQCAELFEEDLDRKRILYMFGGVGVAADAGLVEVIPSEDKKVNEEVARKAVEAIGVEFYPGMDIYELLYSVSEEKQRIMKQVLVEHAVSLERERPVIQNAAKVLKRENFTTVLFGAQHDFEDVVEEMREKGKLKDTALVKFDTIRGDIREKR